MLDLSDGSFLLPLRLVQLVCASIVLMCAIVGRVNLPHFASAISSPTILLIAGIVHVGSVICLIFMFHIFKLSKRHPVVEAVTVAFEVSNYGIAIASFVNMMYDFQFSVPGTYGQVCQLTDSIHNSDPIVGCHFFQAGVSFAAISWFLWTISMTWIVSRIHKRTRKGQMERNRYTGKENERVLESQGSTFSRNHFTNSPLNDVSANQYAHY